MTSEEPVRSALRTEVVKVGKSWAKKEESGGSRRNWGGGNINFSEATGRHGIVSGSGLRESGHSSRQIGKKTRIVRESGSIRLLLGTVRKGADPDNAYKGGVETPRWFGNRDALSIQEGGDERWAQRKAWGREHLGIVSETSTGFETVALIKST